MSFVINDNPSSVSINLLTQVNALVADVKAILAALAASTITGYTAPTQTSATLKTHL